MRFRTPRGLAAASTIVLGATAVAASPGTAGASPAFTASVQGWARVDPTSATHPDPTSDITFAVDAHARYSDGMQPIPDVAWGHATIQHIWHTDTGDVSVRVRVKVDCVTTGGGPTATVTGIVETVDLKGMPKDKTPPVGQRGENTEAGLSFFGGHGKQRVGWTGFQQPGKAPVTSKCMAPAPRFYVVNGGGYAVKELRAGR
jgi:hypothetical protein